MHKTKRSNWLCLGAETDCKISLEQHRTAQGYKHHQHQAFGGGDGAVALILLATGDLAWFYLRVLHFRFICTICLHFPFASCFQQTSPALELFTVGRLAPHPKAGHGHCLGGIAVHFNLILHTQILGVLFAFVAHQGIGYKKYSIVSLLDELCC